MHKNQIVLELQMLTGIMSNDIKYLFDQLVQKGKPTEVKSETPEFVSNIVNDSENKPSIDDWFNKL